MILRRPVRPSRAKHWSPGPELRTICTTRWSGQSIRLGPSEHTSFQACSATHSLILLGSVGRHCVGLPPRNACDKPWHSAGPCRSVASSGPSNAPPRASFAASPRFRLSQRVSPEGFLGLAVEILDARSIPFVLTGSLAGAYHGAPRATERYRSRRGDPCHSGRLSRHPTHREVVRPLDPTGSP